MRWLLRAKIRRQGVQAWEDVSLHIDFPSEGGFTRTDIAEATALTPGDELGQWYVQPWPTVEEGYVLGRNVTKQATPHI